MIVALALAHSTVQGCSHSISVDLRCFVTGAANAANGLAVGVGLRLQQLWVCLNAHDNHLVNGHQSLKAWEHLVPEEAGHCSNQPPSQSCNQPYHAANGLVVGVVHRLQQLWVCQSAHDNRHVNDHQSFKA